MSIKINDLGQSAQKKASEHFPDPKDGQQDKHTLLTIPLKLAKSFARLIMDALFHIQINGLENIPEKGAAILVCNSTDHLDVLIQGVYSPRELIFVIKKELIELKRIVNDHLFQKGSPLYSPTMKFLPTYIEKNLDLLSKWIESQFIVWGGRAVGPSYHEQAEAQKTPKYRKEVEEKMYLLLKEGNIISIFPEKNRTRTGIIGPFRSMAAKLAIQAQVPIIPSGIGGAWRFSTLESFLSGRMFHTLVHYNVGQAMLPQDFPKLKNKKQAASSLTAILEKQVYTLTQQPQRAARSRGMSRVL